MFEDHAEEFLPKDGGFVDDRLIQVDNKLDNEFDGLTVDVGLDVLAELKKEGESNALEGWF